MYNLNIAPGFHITNSLTWTVYMLETLPFGALYSLYISFRAVQVLSAFHKKSFIGVPWYKFVFMSLLITQYHSVFHFCEYLIISGYKMAPVKQTYTASLYEHDSTCSTVLSACQILSIALIHFQIHPLLWRQA